MWPEKYQQMCVSPSSAVAAFEPPPFQYSAPYRPAAESSPFDLWASEQPSTPGFPAAVTNALRLEKLTTARMTSIIQNAPPPRAPTAPLIGHYGNGNPPTAASLIGNKRNNRKREYAKPWGL
jgi:hypothetical protein